MLNLNILGTLFWCFDCWLWTSKCWMVPFRKFSKTRIPEKSRKVTCLAIWKDFKNRQIFQWRPLVCTWIITICHSNHQNTIRILYFLRLIHMADVALWYKIDTKLRSVSQSYTNQFFSSSSFSCLLMKVCESEVYAKHIAQTWDMHWTCLFFFIKFIFITKC